MAPHCPANVELEALLSGTLSSAGSAALEAHLAECVDCRRALDALSGADEIWLRSHGTQALRVDSTALCEAMRELDSRPPQLAEAPASPRARLPNLGAYEIVGELGRGGMGVVYRARQPSLHRDVALKVILSGQFASAREVHRFHVEAEAAAKLHHPHIVPIFEIGEHEGHHYFSMALLEGGSLAERTTKPLDPRFAAELLATLSRAVHYAHERGVLHRDLKPSNVLFDSEGEPHLVDFGVAKLLESDGDFTGSAVTMGTPSYMAPELAAGLARDATIAADVYSLGAILYELITARPPFQEATTTATLQKVIQGEPVRPAALQPSVPRDLETICLKCLEREPTRRYHNAMELAEELERFLRGEPIAARRVLWVERWWRWCRRQPVLSALVAALVIVFVLGLAGVLWSWQGEVAQRELAEQEGRRAKHAVTRLELERVESLLQSGDSSRGLAYLARLLREEPSNYVAAERLMSALTMRSFCLPVAALRHGPALEHRAGERQQALLHRDPFCSPGSLVCANFSPDGSAVVTASKDGTARLWRASDGAPLGEPMRHDGEVLWAQFSADGRSLVTASADGTARIWAADSCRLAAPPLQHEDIVHFASFRPDGEQVVTACRDHAVHVWDVRTGDSLARFDHAAAVYFACFSPDGRLVLSACEDGKAWLWDASAQSSLGTIPHVFNYERLPEPFPRFHPLLEQFVLFRGDNGSVLRDLKAEALREFEAEARPELGHDSYVLGAAYSPSGLSLATVSADAFARIWRANWNTGVTAIPPLRHEAVVQSAEFSGDAQRLVTASRDRAARLWDAATGERLAEPMRHAVPIRSARIAQGGQRVVTSPESDTAWLWDVRVRQPLTVLRALNRGASLARFSPDGKRVLVVDDFDYVRLCDVTYRTAGNAEGAHRHSAAIHEPIGITLNLVTRNSPWRFDHSGDLGTAWRDASFDDAGWTSSEAPFSTDASLGIPAVTPGNPGAKATHVAPGRGTYYFRTRFEVPTVPDGYSLKVVLKTLADDGVVLYLNGVEALRVGMPAGPIAHATRAERDVANAADEGPPEIPPDLLRPGGNVLAAEVHAFESAGAGIGFAATLDAHFPRAEFSDERDAGFQRSHSEDDPHRHPRFAPTDVITPIHYNAVVSDVRFSPDGLSFVAADRDGEAAVWDARSGEPVGPVLRHEGAVTQVRFHPDGQRVATSSLDHRARVWSVGSGDLLFELQHGAEVHAVEFSPDGCLLATTSSDGTAQLWDVQTGDRVGEPLQHDAEVYWAAFDPTGRRVATASADKTARIWSVESGGMLTAPLAHADALHTRNSVCFSPDGTLLATVAGNAAQIWNASTGRAVTPLLRHGQRVNSAQFSRDGRKLLTASEDGTARLWDTETGYPVSEPLRHDSNVSSAEFSPDGSWVLTCSPDRRVRIWEVTSAPLPVPPWLLELAEGLAGQAIDAEEASRAVSSERLYALRSALAVSPGEGTYERWARWFFAESATRTISPSSDLSVREYVELRVAENTLQSLEEATCLSPAHVMAFAQRALAQLRPRARGIEGLRIPQEAWQNGEWFSRYAESLAPGDPELRLIRRKFPPAIMPAGGSKRWRVP